MNIGTFNHQTIEILNHFLDDFPIIIPANAETYKDFIFLTKDGHVDYECIEHCLMEPIQRWEKLKDLTLFSGKFYQVAIDSAYKDLGIQVRDVFSHCQVDVTTLTIGQLILGFKVFSRNEWMYELLLERLTTESTNYPTLVGHFKQ